MLDSILVPLDGSHLAARSLALVRRIVERRASFGEPRPRVLLVRAVSDDEAKAAEARGEDALANAKKELEAARDHVGAEITPTCARGDAAELVVKTAGELHPSLVLMTSHGRTGLDRWIRGSTAERVLRECPAPVLLTNPWSLERTSARAHPFERILVPLDGSERALRILPVVAGIARELGSEVILVHVLPEGSTREEAASEHLDAARASLGGLKVETEVLEGDPATAILDAAQGLGADLVALATHGWSGPSRWFYGSVAQHVLHGSSCPLLVLRTGGFDEPAQAAGERALVESSG